MKDLKGLKKYITKFFGLVSQKDKSPINSTALFFRGHCFKFENELQLAAEDFSKLLKMEFRKWNNLDEDFLANVEFKVFSNIKIPQESVVAISSDGILGNKYLSVIPENRDSKNFFKQGDNFVNVIDFESIEDQVSKIIFLATQ